MNQPKKRDPRNVDVYVKFFEKISQVFEESETYKQTIFTKKQLVEANKRKSMSAYAELEAKAHEFELDLLLRRLIELQTSGEISEESLIEVEICGQWIESGWSDSYSVTKKAFRVSRLSLLSSYDRFQIGAGIYFGLMGLLLVPSFIYNRLVGK